jgi:DNA-binding response OmpR family regulator
MTLIPEEKITTRRVLIVEDNPDNSQILMLIFSGSQYEVHEARTGADGRALIQDKSFDLGLFDIELPDANGLSLAGYLHKQCPEARIIVLSALDDTFLIEQSAQLGASAYVVKPYDLRELITLIHAVEEKAFDGKIKVLKG